MKQNSRFCNVVSRWLLCCFKFRNFTKLYWLLTKVFTKIFSAEYVFSFAAENVENVGANWVNIKSKWLESIFNLVKQWKIWQFCKRECLISLLIVYTIRHMVNKECRNQFLWKSLQKFKILEFVAQVSCCRKSTPKLLIVEVPTKVLRWTPSLTHEIMSLLEHFPILNLLPHFLSHLLAIWDG